ncbi:MAG: NAD(P)-dependent oxidoreductase [Actinomycetes bacterium]
MGQAQLRVGVLGPGIMGGPMAQNMARAGIPVSVWARRPDAAAAVAGNGVAAVGTPRDVAASSDVVLVMLPDLPQLEALLEGPDGLWAGVTSELVLVVASTVSPAGVRSFAERAKAASGGRVRVVDAPVSGGEVKAVDGTLSIMVGGADADVARAWPVLSACGTPTHLGPLGAGQVAKACNQLIVAAEVAALAEASLLARDAGIDLATLFDVLSRGLASSAVLDQKRDKLTHADYTVSGPARFMAKDLRFALEAAATTGRAMPTTSFLRGLYDGLNDAGLGDSDIAIMQRYIDEFAAGPAAT